MTRKKSVVAILFILLLQNILFFHRHYFHGDAFPWDFMLTYHAVPYYWIELSKLGVDTSWIPFQGMGYPLFMNLQSGLFYPVFWLFVAFHKTYTVHAAVLVQGVHVLLGAVGAVVCARLLGLGWRHALLAGVLYQGFGGFYSHASHPDIVRSYAFVPWMSAPVFASWGQMKQSNLLKIGIAMLPFFVYCAWTGGYPGVTIASFFILTITVLARLIFGDDRKIGFTILTAFVSGIFLAAIFLVPVAMQVSEILRSQSSKHYHYLFPSDFLALVYSVNNSYFLHDVTMRSFFVGVPALALLLIGLQNWCIWNKWVLFSGGLALLMATGLLHAIVIKVLPLIGFSRFPIVDYGVFIALSIILLAVTTSQYIEKTKIKTGYAWAIVLLLFLLFGNQILKINGGDWSGDGMRLFTVLLGTILVLGPVLSKKPLWIVPAIIMISLFDWGRDHWSASYFSLSQGQVYSELAMNLANDRKLLGVRLNTTNECRPARLDIGPDGNPASIRGYYSGEYMMGDYAGSMNFRRQQKILSDISLKSFAAMSWRMVLIPDKIKADPKYFQAAVRVKAECLNYSTSEIKLAIDMQNSHLVVENEIYWLGWEAELLNSIVKPSKIIKAVDVNGFRGWFLPAGKYVMIERYKAPYLNLALMLTFFGVMIWLCVVLVLWKCKITFSLKEGLQ